MHLASYRFLVFVDEIATLGQILERAVYSVQEISGGKSIPLATE